jgi:hypothetical protein
MSKQTRHRVLARAPMEAEFRKYTGIKPKRNALYAVCYGRSVSMYVRDIECARHVSRTLNKAESAADSVTRGRDDCHPLFAPQWDAAEQTPGYWLELALLRVEEELYSLKQSQKQKGSEIAAMVGTMNANDFDAWLRGMVNGAAKCRRILRKTLKQSREALQKQQDRKD